MKKVAILVCLLLASVLFSCEKIEDPGLGTFQEMEDVIDMSKTNQYTLIVDRQLVALKPACFLQRATDCFILVLSLFLLEQLGNVLL